MGKEAFAATEFTTTLSAYGREYAAKHRAFQEHWRSHRDGSAHKIMEGARLAQKESVLILGASDGKDIPLSQLLQEFSRVRLVDIDQDSMALALASLTGRDRQRCEIHCTDLTSGAVAQLMEAATAIIAGAATSRQAYRRLVNLYNELPVVLDLGELIAPMQSTYVVSSVLSSQLLSIPDRWIAVEFEKKFGAPLKEVHSDKLDTARRGLCRRLQKQHANLLAQSAPGAMVYWSCDVRQELVIGKMSPALTQRLGEQMNRFLQGYQWQTLLAVESPAVPGTGEFTAWVMSLIGKGKMPSSTELEIIEYMIDAAQSLEPAVTKNIIDGSMADYFEPHLKPVGQPESWLWHLNPPLYYRGGVHKVEAWLLRSLVPD